MIRKFWESSSGTKWLIVTLVVFMGVTVFGWIYAYARLPYSRSYAEKPVENVPK